MTRVVLADDSVIFREALAELLTARGFEVCGLAGDADGLLAVAADVRPDVCVVDIRMPPRGLDDGLRAAHEILRTRTSAVLLLSQHVHVTHALDLLSGGARGFGYLLKDRISDVDEFTEAIGLVRAGGTVFDTEITRLLLGKRQAVTERLANDRLSERERDVLLLIAEGRSNRSIAGRLGVSEGTVEKHCSKIFSKFHLEPNLDDHRRVLLVLHFLAHG